MAGGSSSLFITVSFQHLADYFFDFSAVCELKLRAIRAIGLESTNPFLSAVPRQALKTV
jgi:hypothetical protein